MTRRFIRATAAALVSPSSQAIAAGSGGLSAGLRGKDIAYHARDHAVGVPNKSDGTTTGKDRAFGGNVRIVGRKKDLIIRGGHNIHPARIEDLAMRHRAVFKAAAFPVADPRLGEKVCLAVVSKSRGTIEPTELLIHLDGMSLSKYDMPEYFIQLDTFPLTANGKVLKRRLVDDAAKGRIRPEPIRFDPKTMGASAAKPG
jgi:acyl-CoA synthetase (AMP-forming)/AMP-acid ligase II